MSLKRTLEVHWPPPADRWAALALAGLTAALFGDVLFRGRAFYERDIQGMVYAQVESFVRCVAAGSWPVWNPYAGFGQPLLANPGAQVLYPWTWLNLLVSPASFYTAYVAGHVFLTGLGFYALLRRLALSRGAALTGAALWMASGPLLSLVSLWQHFAGAAWIPWVLLAADRALSAPAPRRALAWGATMAGQFFAGSAEMAVATSLVLAVYTLRYLRLLEPLSPGNRRVMRSALLAAVFALALSAAQWLPALELLEGTQRAALRDWTRTYWSLHPISLVQTMLPVFPRDLPLQRHHRDLLFESREPFLNSIYLGLGSLPLAAASFLGARRRLAAFFAGTAIAAVLLALGRHAFPYYFAVSLVPVLRVFRYPAKAMVVAAFAWAVMAGLGLDAARREERDRRGAWLLLLLLPAGIVTALVWAASFGAAFRAAVWSPSLLSADSGRTFSEILAPVARTLAVAAAAASAVIALLAVRLGRSDWASRLAATAGLVAVGELAFAHHDLNPTAPGELFTRPPDAVSVLKAERAITEQYNLGLPTRVLAFDYLQRVSGRTYRRGPFVEPVPPPARDMPVLLRRALASQACLRAPTGERWGFFGSFEFDALGLQRRPLRNLTLVFRASEETPNFLRLLQIASVSHVIALHTEGLEGLIQVATLSSPVAGDLHVFRVPSPQPRIYLVPGSRAADGLPALEALVDPGFDFAREVILPPGAPGGAAAAFSGDVRLLTYLPDRIQIEARLDRTGYLVVVDAYDPGWRATVDGRDAPVLRANVAFRAVPVPAGAHLVELRYRPRSVIAGLVVSAAALLLGLGWAMRP